VTMLGHLTVYGYRPDASLQERHAPVWPLAGTALEHSVQSRSVRRVL
jgi:hypothetical protein